VPGLRQVDPDCGDECRRDVEQAHRSLGFYAVEHDRDLRLERRDRALLALVEVEAVVTEALAVIRREGEDWVGVDRLDEAFDLCIGTPDRVAVRHLDFGLLFGGETLGFEKRLLIEALRDGVPTLAVGAVGLHQVYPEKARGLGCVERLDRAVDDFGVARSILAFGLRGVQFVIHPSQHVDPAEVLPELAPLVTGVDERLVGVESAVEPEPGVRVGCR